MYEGKNIHYSQADQRPLCSFSGKICRQRRLNGYALCLRHILEDPTAPYKRCAHIAKNGQQCSNIIPQSRRTDFCNSHMQVHTSSPFQLAPSAGLAIQSLAKSQQNGLGEGLPTFSGSTRSQTANKMDSSEASMKQKLDRTTPSEASSISPVQDDPYAFPSDPEPVKVNNPSSSLSSLAHPFPNLSQALANLASSNKHHLPDQRQEGTSSIVRLFPELADKLDIGKANRARTETAKVKTSGLAMPSTKVKATSTCSASSLSLGDHNSSRTMNRLQTKIAQNKIKDKLRKNSDRNNSSNQPSHSNMQHSNTNSLKASQSSSQTSSSSAAAAAVTSGATLSSSLSSLGGGATGRRTIAGSLVLGQTLNFSAKLRTFAGKKSHISSPSTTATPTSVTNHQMSIKGRATKALKASASKVGDWLAAKTEQTSGSTVTGVSAHDTVNNAMASRWAGLGNQAGDGHDTGLHQMAPLDSPLACVPPFAATTLPQTDPEQVAPANSLSPAVIRGALTTTCSTATGIVSTNSLHSMGLASTSVSSTGQATNDSGVISNRMPADVASSSAPAYLAHSANNQPHAAKDNSNVLSIFNQLPASTRPNKESSSAEKRHEKCASSERTDVSVLSDSGRAVVPPCIKIRCFDNDLSTLRSKLKRHSALNVCLLREKRKWRNTNICPMGVDSSEDDDTDVDEALPYQQEWLLSSDSEREDESLVDDPLLADIRHTKQKLLHAKLRRCFIQVQKAYHRNVYIHSSHTQELSLLLRSARIDPQQAAEAVKLNLREADPPSLRSPRHCLLDRRPCLCKTDGDKLCTGTALPFTNHCSKHIMYNVEQQPYDYCTAKFSDNTQCCVPVLDIKHELPLCPEHAAKAENYQKNLEASRPKKPRKKTKPSALTRPPKKGKKKKNQRKNNKIQREMSPLLANSNSNSVLPTADELSADDNAELTSDLRPPSSPESKVALDADLGSDLEESFSPDIIDKHLELPLGEHDLNEVLNKLPDDAFELFTGKNGDFSVNSKVEEEAAVFEHVLAETSKKLKASESLGHDTGDGGHGLSLMMGNDRRSEGADDDLTKEIADSILQQDLSPAGSIVDDLGQDNISALASSLSANDLRNISQVLSATLIHSSPSTPPVPADIGNSPTTFSGNAPDIGNPRVAYSGGNTPALGDHPATVPASEGMPTEGPCMNQGQGHVHSLVQSSLDGLGSQAANSYPYMNVPMTSSLDLASGSTGGQEFMSPITGTGQAPGLQDHHPVLDQHSAPVTGASSTQCIAQILAALTASTKQFATAPNNASLDGLLQVPGEDSSGIGSTETAPSVLANQYATSPSIGITQQQTCKQAPMSPHNGLLSLPMLGTSAPVGLKSACQMPAVLPLGLLDTTSTGGLAPTSAPATSQGQDTSRNMVTAHPAAPSSTAATNP